MSRIFQAEALKQMIHILLFQLPKWEFWLNNTVVNILCLNSFKGQVGNLHIQF